MDRYKASIESVDSALNRLNQTLASYKLLLSDSTASIQSHARVPASSGEPSASTRAPETARSETAQSDEREAAHRRPTTVSSPQAEYDNLIKGFLCSLRASRTYPERNLPAHVHLRRVNELQGILGGMPYSLPLQLLLAGEYMSLGYPDLAAGSAYKALLLSDALENEAEEYHQEATESLEYAIQLQPLDERAQLGRTTKGAEPENPPPSNADIRQDVEAELWLAAHFRLIMYRLLTRSLLMCGCLRSAMSYCRQATRSYPTDQDLRETHTAILAAVKEMGLPLPETANSPLTDWPDHGMVRRELYPWNRLEPDRLEKLGQLNDLMSEVSTKLEVRAVDLPALGEDGGYSRQLGVFAKADIAPGEEVLNETSLLTANNKLQEALCDACSADLPDSNSARASSVVACAECEVVFCSQWCHDAAQELYHEALCDKDVEAIAKDVPPSEAADSLYVLLLLRTLAMAETQCCHPLDLHEVKYIWGDFTPRPPLSDAVYTDVTSPTYCPFARTLPFSFEYNIRLPLHMLEKMDVDIFANPQYEVWVLNTLYAKFRGTASARLSGLGGRAIRGPEVSAVHPMWCLANHSCDPNVSWEWGGSIKFWAREERIASRGGIKKGDEVLNHYCDITLPVQERRDWARGALGGDCQCSRCFSEAAASK